jgi:hypothetical protein
MTVDLLVAQIRSAHDAKGKGRRAAALDKPGYLMPVDAIGIDLGHRRGDAKPPEL